MNMLASGRAHGSCTANLREVVGWQGAGVCYRISKLLEVKAWFLASEEAQNPGRRRFGDYAPWRGDFKDLFSEVPVVLATLSCCSLLGSTWLVTGPEIVQTAHI